MMNSYILTYSGRQFSYAYPHESDVVLEDVSHALSNLNRFTGHSRFGFSVAQHSLAVAAYLEAIDAPLPIVFAGLVHDAHEAYFGDVSSPLKAFLKLSEPEARIQAVVLSALGTTLEWVKHPLVHEADLVALKVEKDVLMPHDEPWAIFNNITSEMCLKMPTPFEQHAGEVKYAFIEKFNELKEKLGEIKELAFA